MARTHSRSFLAALALIASSTGCTVYSYSMPPSHAPASYASAPRYEHAPVSYASAPRYAAPRDERAQAEPVARKPRAPGKAPSYTPVKPKKPAMYSEARKPSAKAEHEPKKPLAYAPVKPKKPLAYTPVKPKTNTQAHKVASTGVLGNTQKPKADTQRGGADSIRERVAAMARQKRLERERKGTPPDETSREHARKKRMQEALAAATKRKRD